MNSKLSPLVIAGIAVAALLLIGGLSWMLVSVNANGEAKNPNVGHSTMPELHTLTKSSSHDLDSDSYRKMLKLHRPDLSDAELDAKVEHWREVNHSGK